MLCQRLAAAVVAKSSYAPLLIDRSEYTGAVDDLVSRLSRTWRVKQYRDHEKRDRQADKMSCDATISRFQIRPHSTIR